MTLKLSCKKLLWIFVLFTQVRPLVAQAASNKIELLKQALENHNLVVAEKILKELQPKTDFYLIAEVALRLAHQEWQMGAQPQAQKLLDDYWSEIEKSQLASYGWMLKARMSLAQDKELAWQCFQRAENLLDIQNWPQDDSTAYALLNKELQEEFEHKLSSIERLIDCDLQDEAIAALTSLISSLMNATAVGYSLNSAEGMNLLRHLILQKAQVSLNQNQPLLALETFEDWPLITDFTHHKDPRLAFNQQMQLQFLEAKAFSMLGRSEEALSHLEQCIEVGKRQKTDAFLLLQTQLFYAQELYHIQKNESAIEALQDAQQTVRQCRDEQFQEAVWRWTKLNTEILTQMGMFHQALDELNQQMNHNLKAETKSHLLFIQASLYEQLQDKEKAFNTFLHFLNLPAEPTHVKYAIHYVIRHIEQDLDSLGPIDQIIAKLLPILKSSTAEIDPTSKLHLCQWIIQSETYNKQELKVALSPWLEAIQLTTLRPMALYLLVNLHFESDQHHVYYKELVDKWPYLTNRWSRLATAFIYFHKPSLDKPHLNLIELATDSTDDFIKQQIVYWAVEKSLETADPQAYEWVEQVLYHVSDEEKNSAFWRLVIAQHGLQQNNLKLQDNSEQEHERVLQSLQVLHEISRLPGAIGLKAAICLTENFVKHHQINEAHQLLQAWARLNPLPEELYRKCLLVDADLLYHHHHPEARNVLSLVLNKWPNFEQRPWLQLRLFTKSEYIDSAPGAIENLHQIILHFIDHPVSLSAYYLLACNKQATAALSQQLQCWEDVEKKSAALRKKGVILTSETESLVIDAALKKAYCLEKMSMYKQAAHTLNSLLTKTTPAIIDSSIEQNLEHQIRFELSRLLLLQKEDEKAKVQLYHLIKDPFASLWQSYAQIELAKLELEQGRSLQALDLIKELSMCTYELQRERLLLSAKCWHDLGQDAKAYACLAQILDQKEVSEELLEALWLVYEWNLDHDSYRALKALKRLSTFKDHPRGQQASSLLSSHSKAAPL